MASNFFVFGVFLGILATSSFAGLQVVPTMVKLSDEQRVTTVSLRHLGKGVGRYRLSLIFNRMKPDGSMEEVKDPMPEERFASKYIRFSPQMAVLQPNVEQVAKVMVVAPKNLPEGDYRAHLLFDPTDDTEGEKVGGTVKGKGAIGMNLEAKMSVAVPVLYRHGNPTVKVKLAGLGLGKMPDGAAGFRVNILTEGNAFARGDIQVTYTPQGKEPIEVALLRSVPAYVKERSVTSAITLPSGVQLAKGQIKVAYFKEEVGGVKGELLDSIQTNIDLTARNVAETN